MIIFETARLRVRQFHPVYDRENFFRLNGDEEVMRYIRPAKSRDESDAFLKEVTDQALLHPGTGRWAVEQRETNLFAGSFAIIPVEGTGGFQLGYALLKKNWGRGYALELTRGGLDFYFSNPANQVIYGITEAPNRASQQVLIKAGFRFNHNREEKGKELMVFLFDRAMR